MNIEFADRVKKLPNYLFTEIEKIMETQKAMASD